MIAICGVKYIYWRQTMENDEREVLLELLRGCVAEKESQNAARSF